MKEYVAEGNTVDEAVQEGLKTLNTTRDNVEVEILQQPKKKLFGLSSTKALVHLKKKSEAKIEEQTAQIEPQPEPARSGLVWVTDNKLGYEPPEEGGQPPGILIDSQIKAVYNGQPVNKQVTLDKGIDTLSLILPEEVKPHAECRVDVCPDGLTAHLIWERLPGEKFDLLPQKPANFVPLRVMKTNIQAPTLTTKDVRIVIQAEGITHGLDLSNITPELLSRPTGMMQIAQGTAPIPPQNARVEHVYKETEPEIDLDSLRIDHYQVRGIFSVEVGTLLARKIPKVEGIPGIDVYGNEIPVQPSKDVELKCGNGVSISDDGLTATAAIAGLPQRNGDKIEVIPILELQSDADISTGNVLFDGAINIKGNVLENVKVESKSGTVNVDGFVSGAVIKCKGAIVVRKNVVASQLYAGGVTIAQLKIAGMLHSIGNQLKQFVQAYKAVASQGSNIQTHELAKHLLNLKFQTLPQEVKALASYFSTVSAELNAPLHQLVAALTMYLLGQGSKSITDIKILENLLVTLKGQEEILRTESTGVSNVHVRYLQNSRVEASGSVIIEGQGSYYSTVSAGRGFRMDSGVYRGGQIVVNSGDIVVKEIGGPTGVATEAMIVTEEGRFTAQRVYSNVTVAIGNQKYKFREDAVMVQVYLINGELTIYADRVKLLGE